MRAMKAPSDPQLDSIRVPPHSIEAEQSVLGGLLLASVAIGMLNWPGVTSRLGTVSPGAQAELPERLLLGFERGEAERLAGAFPNQ